MTAVTPLAWAALAAAMSAAAGAFLPRLIAALPERYPDDPTTYRQIAAARHLPIWLALASGAVGAAMGWARAGQPDLPAFVVLGLLGTGMAYVDLRRHLLPDRMTLPALGTGAVLLGMAALVGSDEGTTSYPRAWAGAGALLVLFFLLVLIYPAGMGLGDVKLAAALGLHLGWLSWSAVVVGTVAAFIVGGLVSIALLVAGRATRKTAVPFGPSMLVGALIAVLWAEPIATWYLG